MAASLLARFWNNWRFYRGRGLQRIISINTATTRLQAHALWIIFILFLFPFYVAGHQPAWAQADAAATAPNAFQLVENFDGIALGSLNGRNGWQSSSGVAVVADPQGGANQVMQIGASNVDREAFKALPTVLDNSSTGTLHFRLRRADHLDGFAGASAQAAPNDWTAFEAQFGGQSNYAADQFVARNGGLFQPLANNFGAQNWYCVWLVINNQTDRYNAYVQGGAYNTPSLIGESIRLRNSTAETIKTFYTRLDDRTQSDLFLDDIYFDPTGENLSAPGQPCGTAPQTLDFQKIDDFDDVTTGTLHGRNGWQASDGVSVVLDPQENTNQVLRLTDASLGDLAAYKALPTALANSSTGTLHFRLRRDGHLDGFAGLSDQAAPFEWPSFEAQFGAQSTVAEDLFVVRNGDAFATPSNGFGDRVWYCVWLVANNSTDQYQAYVQGGNFTNVTTLGNFNFRNGGSDPLRTFYARLDDRSTSSLYLDDLYFDPDSENLTVPGNACGAATATNDPPVANPDSYTTAQNSILEGSSVLNNDSDPNGDALLLDTTPVTTVSQGTLTLRADGTFRYQPNQAFSGQDSFVYRVCDQATPSLCSQATATITVTAICYPLTRTHEGSGSDPSATPANSTNCPSGQYRAGEVINLSATPTQGWLVDRWSGTADDSSTALTNWLTMPDAAHTVSVRYREGITNNPPTANNDTVRVDENSTNNVINPLANDSTAPDTGETLTIIAVGSPTQNGRVTFNNTTIIYSPASNFVGEERFTYRIADGNGGTAEATVIVTVEATASTVDLVAEAVEVTQGIQDLQNSVRLVAQKETYVRFHVRSSEGNYNSSAQLRVRQGGAEVLLNPINPDGTATVRSNPNRAALHHAFLFQLPPAYTQGTVQLTATLNPAQDPVENNVQNNTAETTVTFETVPTLNLVLYAIGYGNNIYPSTFHQDRLVEWLRQAYPLHNINVVRRSLYMGNSLPTCIQVNATLATKRNWDLQNRATPPGAHYYGMVDDNNSRDFFMRGCASTIPAFVASGPTGSGTWASSFRWDSDGSYGDWYGGHEMGHMYQRYHAEFCGAIGGSTYPYPEGRISPALSGPTAIYGFNARTQDIYDANWKDMMTYCANQWISDFTYEGLMTFFQTYAIGITPAGDSAERLDRLMVVGTIDPATEQVTLQSTVMVPDATSLGASVPGDYAIVLRDQAGTELARYPFTPYAMESGPAAPNTPAGGEVNQLLISELVPYVAGTTRIDIEKLGVVLASVEAGAAEPIVTLLQPQGGETLDQAEVTVSWAGQDPDGDALAFTVQYSADLGQTWSVIASDVEGNEVTVDNNNLAGSREGIFRVWASDGIHAGSATTAAPVIVPNHAPSVKIVTPADAIEVVVGTALVLEGQAYDVDEPDNSALELTWSSNIDGILGKGATLGVPTLSQGNHTVTLYADDGAGGISAHSVKINVVAASGGAGPADELLVGPQQLAFTANSAVQSVSIALDNRNGRAPIRWTVNTPVSWLSITEATGVTPHDLTVTFQPGDLAPGDYSTDLTFVSPDQPGQSVTIRVSATVPEGTTPSGNTTFLPFIAK